MRAATRIRDASGWLALALALLLASPGVRLSQAEDFSYDPALEPTAPAARVEVTGAGPSCAAQQLPVVAPSPLRNLPLLVADGDEAVNSLNGRGYNIGKSEPDAELQRLLFEVRRQGR